MGLFNKLVTAVRGHATEAGEALADANALTILDQEIRDTDVELRKSDQALTTIMAKRKLQDNKTRALDESIAKYEAAARKAVAADNNGLALDCASKVGELREERASEQEMQAQYLSSEQTLKANIKQAKGNLKRMKQQVETVKATQSVQKAQAAVSSRFSGANSNMKTAAESLERIKSQQAQTAAELDSAQELADGENGNELELKLQAAGIGANSEANDADELARILEGAK